MLSVFSEISEHQRQVIEQHGTPMPLFDEAAGTAYMLLSVEFLDDPDGGLTARIPGIDAYGEGETEQDAALALQEALRRYITAFG